ncbi:rhodanese-like domain-containing protein [Hymenobacter sp. UV11]|uniref:rhodanese-like domain-containing protein n=1 Tax=Hymenobacter sp. UV11 TaxID=1849735 RepID=UPI00105F0B2D|nr:rhodanese-like domain-containing protein [Hymenobacter sp. UV11]TDN36692.1 rhodanese [Hymenobacter sp. UV11]TFZ66195.1 rhodanese-like domain-containing protein [Hymenobacter sp. UV11]
MTTSSFVLRLGSVLLLLGLVAACQSRKADAPPTTNKLYSAMLNGVLKESVPFVSVAQLKSQPAPVLLDTRAPEEFSVSHLRGAKWVGYDKFSLAEVQDIPKNTPIVVYCSVGVRSEKIGAKLQAAGFTNVRNLYGGLFEWMNEGQPVFTADNQPTDRVHAYSPAWGIWLQRGQKVY